MNGPKPHPFIHNNIQSVPPLPFLIPINLTKKQDKTRTKWRKIGKLSKGLEGMEETDARKRGQEKEGKADWNWRRRRDGRSWQQQQEGSEGAAGRGWAVAVGQSKQQRNREMRTSLARSNGGKVVVVFVRSLIISLAQPGHVPFRSLPTIRQSIDLIVRLVSSSSGNRCLLSVPCLLLLPASLLTSSSSTRLVKCGECGAG